jgi:hypothetical protein
VQAFLDAWPDGRVGGRRTEVSLVYCEGKAQILRFSTNPAKIFP